jgi:CubicO group peptidase (beta-lactamase class C family)
VRGTKQFVTACTNSLLLLALICASLHAQTLTDRADLLLAKWNRKDEPEMAVLLIRNGRVEYRNGFGLADLDKRTPVSPDTQFSVESVAKQFTPMAIMIR